MSNRLWIAAAAGSALLVPLLFRDYQAFMILGPGGLPHNAIGWAISNIVMKPIAFGSDVLSTKPYESTSAQDPSFLPEHFPPRRSGERPTFGSHPIPHRQTNQFPSEDVKAMLMKRVVALGQRARDDGTVVIAGSKLERYTDAFFVHRDAGHTRSDSAVSAATDTRGEFAHVHSTSEHSLHVILSPADCIKVLNAHWGERHTFDGSNFARYALKRPFPATYILIYAPRTEEEVDIVMSIVEASIAYMTGATVREHSRL